MDEVQPLDDKQLTDWLHYRILDIGSMGLGVREMLLRRVEGDSERLNEVLTSASLNANHTILEDIAQAFLESIVNDYQGEGFTLVEATVKLEKA